MTHYSSCTLCEASCGVAIEVENGRVVSIRGDKADPFSHGYICPKAAALGDLHHDPDRLRRPIARDGVRWREIPWDDAFDMVASRIDAIRKTHGPDAVAVYQGNPTAHNLGLMTFGQLFLRKLGTKNLFSASSVDQLPHMVAAHHMFGDGLMMPVPDLDRTDFFLCIGGNPLVSNGSIMTAPDMRRRLQTIRARGGRVVVIDPRRTETAAAADRHLFIRPGTDALLLSSMLHVIFADGLARPGRVGTFTDGIADLERITRDFTPEACAPVTGMPASDVRWLAREFAGARGAAYGRVGLCTQEFGGLAAWLLYALNGVCGRIDEPGGMMFTTPAVDPSLLAKAVGLGVGFDRWRSRVRGLPEYGGELPVAVLAEEIESPGPGQVRALIVSAGNPVLSTPNGARLDRLLPRLEFIAAIDPYLNETTRHAHVILPPTSVLERSHYDVALLTLAVRNVAKYSPPIFERSADQRHDWEICLELWTRLGMPGLPFGPFGKIAGNALKPVLARIGPEGILDLGLRAGAYGLRLKALRNAPHGLDLGPLVSRLPARLRGSGAGRRGPLGRKFDRAGVWGGAPRKTTRGKRIDIAPRLFVDDMQRLQARMAAPAPDLVLIGRRQLHSNNSWCHNSARLVKGKPRCTLLIHPRDAGMRGIRDGDLVSLSSRTGRVDVPATVTADIMPGVVSLPHGWGHNREGVRLRVAGGVPGASINDVTDEEAIDALTGTAAVSGVPVDVNPLASPNVVMATNVT